MRRLHLLVTVLLLALGLSPVPAAHGAQAAALQLVADQEAAMAGDTVRYHLLYHNQTEVAAPEVKLKLTLPAGLDLADTTGVNWDPITRTAVWTLSDVEAGGARVIHLGAKVTGKAAAGAALPVTLGGAVEGGLSLEAPTVGLRVGQPIHQPLFIGFPDGKFHPTTSLTRAEAAAIATRVKQLPPVGPDAPTFEDVPEEHWAREYISRAADAGYMAGSDGLFRPDEPLSRAELVSLLLRLRGVTALPFEPFAETAGHRAADAISTAHALGWIEGDGLGQFLPDAPTERQVAAKLFAIALYRRPLTDGDATVVQHFPDVPTDSWAFGWVEEVSMTAHESRTDGLQEYLIRYLPDQTHPL